MASAESWNPSQGRFMDLSGNGRVGTLQAGAVSVGSVSGNGANWSVPYVGGTTGTEISWGAASIPSTFTICSIARYSGVERARMLHCRDKLWIHGGRYGNSGWIEYGGLYLGHSGGPVTDWVVACGRNNLTAGSAVTIINGVARSVTEGEIVTLQEVGHCELTLNQNSPSDWQLSKLYVWNTHLPDAVFADASARLNSYLANVPVSVWGGGVRERE